ncbi:MAG TPA: hypothetical protein VGI50_01545 [Solirubrobacteraceae bacterium]
MSHWITAWAANAAIAVGWLLYVEQFVNKEHTKVFSTLPVLVGLWVPAMINLAAVNNMGLMQPVTQTTWPGGAAAPALEQHSARPRRGRRSRHLFTDDDRQRGHEDLMQRDRRRQGQNRQVHVQFAARGIDSASVKRSS